MLWTILALVIILGSHTLVSVLRHPVGGGALHEIFAYSEGGREEVSRKVWLEHVLTGSVVASLLILFRFRVHWMVITLLAGAVAYWSWLQICFFPCQSYAHYRYCTRLIHLIVPIILLSGFIAHLLSRLIPRRGKQGSASRFNRLSED